MEIPIISELLIPDSHFDRMRESKVLIDLLMHSVDHQLVII